MLNTNPPKGTQDRYPAEFAVRKYIFDTWREVCQKFGYQEYLGPLVETADIWRAKSGEDVGGSELTLITNRDGKISDLAIRPEMTPTVTRMVAKNYTQMAKPIRYFSIANFYRNERPQRGRNREFWQLNVDLFGSESLQADIEILQMGMELMISFNPPKDSWELNINNRYLIDEILTQLGVSKALEVEVVRLMDKREKLSQKDFEAALADKGLTSDQVQQVISYMTCTSLEELVNHFAGLQDTKGYIQTTEIINKLTDLGYGEYISFKPSLIRGFDYYDGMVFEIFDKHPENNRALFGGGRYNGLAEIFGGESFPAVGFAPGDETMKLFLESRGLLEKAAKKMHIRKMYIPVLDTDISEIAKILRKQGRNVVTGLESQKFGKAMQYADKQGYDFVVIYGSQEAEKGVYKVKDMKTGKEKDFDLKERFCSKRLNNG